MRCVYEVAFQTCISWPRLFLSSLNGVPALSYATAYHPSGFKPSNKSSLTNVMTVGEGHLILLWYHYTPHTCKQKHIFRILLTPNQTEFSFHIITTDYRNVKYMIVRGQYITVYYWVYQTCKPTLYVKWLYCQPPITTWGQEEGKGRMNRWIIKACNYCESLKTLPSPVTPITSYSTGYTHTPRLKS